MSFEGSGKSKKDAKLNASKALLVHLHKVGFDPMTGEMMSTQQNNADAAIGHSLADKIGQIVHAKYQALFGTTTYSKVNPGQSIFACLSLFSLSFTEKGDGRSCHDHGRGQF